MIRLKALLASVLAALGAILAAVFLGKQAKKAKAESESLKNSLDTVAKKAGRLQETLGETAKTEEKANEERKDLAGTPDSDLVHRANNLF